MELDGLVEIKEEPEEGDIVPGLGMDEERRTDTKESFVITVQPYFNDDEMAGALAESGEDLLVAPERQTARTKSKVQSRDRKKKNTNGKKYSCTTCNFRGTAASLKIHMISHARKRKTFSCKFCDYESAVAGSVKAHMLTHHTNLPRYFCGTCAFKCTVIATMRAHMKTHSAVWLYTCKTCGFSCGCKDTMRDHLTRTKHRGDKPYSCGICSFRVATKLHLEEHMDTHTEAKPFACHHCEFTTRRKLNLLDHMMGHTGMEPGHLAERVACDSCGYETNSPSDLNYHKMTHGGFFCCDVCGYRCDSARALCIHKEQAHSTEDVEPFACKFCDFRCSDGNGLILHSQTH